MEMKINFEVTDPTNFNYLKTVLEKLKTLSTIFEFEVIDEKLSEHKAFDSYHCSLTVSVLLDMHSFYYKNYVEILQTFALEYDLSVLTNKTVPCD